VFANGVLSPVIQDDQKLIVFFKGLLNADGCKRESEIQCFLANTKLNLGNYEKYACCFWKVLARTNGDFIGITGLLHQKIDDEAATEIFYRIIPKYWNKGYATESAHACKEYAENIWISD
jgi:RimJ/RimL family protein N-acetyltransferase